MNRAQRRNLANKGKIKYTPEQIELAKLIYLRNECKGRFKDGDKVRLNMEFMTATPDWQRKVPEYRNWCNEHAGDEMTVMYDTNHMEDPELVCLIEDESSPKWLFSVIDLMPAAEDDGFMDKVNWVKESYQKSKKAPTN